MDLRSAERWVLERHEATIREAERRHVLLSGVHRPRVSQLVARRLRQIADRIEGPSQPEPGLPSGSQLLSNGPF